MWCLQGCYFKDEYNKEHHIFEAPTEIDGTHWSKNDLSVGENIVADNLKNSSFIRAGYQIDSLM